MKAVSQTIFLTIMLVAASASTAAVYKYIDENGNVAYGDKPVEGAKKVKIHGVRRKPEPEYNGNFSDDFPEEEQADGKSAYKSLEVLAPKSGHIFDERTGSVQIILLPSPNLASTDRLIISFNGKDVSKGRDSNLSLRNIPAGKHKVNGRIIDANGTVVMQSRTVSFEVGKP